MADRAPRVPSIVIVAAWLIGCGPSPEPVQPAAVVTPPTPKTTGGTGGGAPSTASAEEDGHAPPEGRYFSESCGDRTYRREVLLRGGFFRVRDLISPCPPGQTCAWSGVVEQQGSYRITHDGIVMTSEQPPPPKSAPLNSPWGIDANTGMPYETTADEVRCDYEKM